MEQPQRAFLASLQLLKALDELESYGLELGFPMYETWEACFAEPTEGNHYEYLEAAHIRFMYTEKRLQEVKKRLFFSGPHEFLGELAKMIDSWIKDVQALTSWLDSEDGQIQDEETEKAKIELEQLSDLLKEIGGRCPFKLNSDDELDERPTYDKLDAEVRIRVFSALTRWACSFHEDVLQALHEQSSDVLEVARSEPIGWDNAGNAYFWFQEIAPYRIFRERYPKPQPIKSESMKDQKKKKQAAEDEEDRKKSTKAKTSSKRDLEKTTEAGKSKEKKDTEPSKKSNNSNKSNGKNAAMKSSQKKRQKVEEDEKVSSKKSEKKKEELNSRKKNVSESSPAKKSKSTPSKMELKEASSSSDDEEENEEESSESESDEAEQQREKVIMPKKIVEEEIRFTSSGRVIRMPPPIQQFTQPPPKKPTPAAVESTPSKKKTIKDSTSSNDKKSRGSSEKNAKKSSSSTKEKSASPSSKTTTKTSSKNKNMNVEDTTKSKKKPESDDEPEKDKEEEVSSTKQERIEDEKSEKPCRDFGWNTLVGWDCMCTDLESLTAFVKSMNDAKENGDFLKALKHVMKYADEIAKEMHEAIEEAMNKRQQAIRRYQIKLAYEEAELARKQRNAELRANYNGPLLGAPIQLRRSGRVTRPTEAARMNLKREADDGSDSDEDSDDSEASSGEDSETNGKSRHRVVSERDRKFMQPSRGTRRSRRLAGIQEDESENNSQDEDENHEQNESNEDVEMHDEEGRELHEQHEASKVEDVDSNNQEKERESESTSMATEQVRNASEEKKGNSETNLANMNTTDVIHENVSVPDTTPSPVSRNVQPITEVATPAAPLLTSDDGMGLVNGDSMIEKAISDWTEPCESQKVTKSHDLDRAVVSEINNVEGSGKHC